jgi:adenylate kinase family enzyme
MPDRKITIANLEERIGRELPAVVFVVGKTCTGKSTFARSLARYDYKQIELDWLVREHIAVKITQKNRSEAFLVYGGNGRPDWQAIFEQEANALIKSEVEGSKIVVDVAISNPEVLRRIIGENLSNYIIVFIHPHDKEFYRKSVTNRFLEDAAEDKITFPIWDFVTPEIEADFRQHGVAGELISNLIFKYADEGRLLSEQRLQNFLKIFPNMIVTGH